MELFLSSSRHRRSSGGGGGGGYGSSRSCYSGSLAQMILNRFLES